MPRPMRVSVITPSFNQARYIEHTVRSVLGQRGEFDLEYLVVDGGSTDGTLDILRRYGERLVWTSEPDSGQSDALNKGFRRATGDVIGWLNSDDLYEAGALDAVVRFFCRHPQCHWALGRCRIIDEHGREVRRFVTWYKNLLLSAYSFTLLLTENFVSQPAVFFRREVLDEVGYLDPSQHLVMDYEFWLRIGSRHTPGLIPQTLSAFRWHGSSKTSTAYSQSVRELYAAARRHRPWYSPPLLVHFVNMWKIRLAYGFLARFGNAHGGT